MTLVYCGYKSINVILYSLEAQNYAAELKLRAERKLGVLLKETAREPGERDEMFRAETYMPPTLSEMWMACYTQDEIAEAVGVAHA